jgi:rubrerythrin
VAPTHNTELTAAEISSLWTSYQNDSMEICGINYYLAHIEDSDIRSVLEYALDISKQHVEKVKAILNAEHYPIPVGFTEQDVNLEAPRLFTDKLYLLYILNMGKFGLSSYALALSLVARNDIIQYYSDCLAETKKLHNDAKKVAKEKGIYVRPPVLPKPEQVDFVKKQSFLTGYLGNRRPLLAVEIANLVYNAKRNALGQAIIIGFSQVAKNKEVRKYLERGRDISKKHFEVFNSLLHEDFVNGTVDLAQEVTDSKVSPFSDKLMMYHIAALTASGIGQYGMAMSTSPRHDLGVTYTRLMAEIMHFSEDGANIMIDHGWMEQPPEAADRKKLAKG